MIVSYVTFRSISLSMIILTGAEIVKFKIKRFNLFSPVIFQGGNVSYYGIILIKDER